MFSDTWPFYASRLVADNTLGSLIMLADYFESHAFFTTLRITVPSKDGVSNSIGTGFICTAPLRQEGRVGTFLVSNRHVYGDPKGTIVLNFHRRASDTNTPLLGDIVPLKIENFSPLYYAHPDADVDLACINISAFADPERGVFHKQLDAKFIDDGRLQSVHAGQLVSFIGYPDNRFDAKHNLPLLRKGYLATPPTVDFNGLKQIVIDAHVFPGSSGSPVFVEINGHYFLLGVIAQTMIKHATLQTIPTGHNYSVEQTIGLGLVLKTSLVTELLSKAASELSDRVDAASMAAQSTVQADNPASGGTAA